MKRFTPALGRDVELRDNGSDPEVWDATFNHLYHVPPIEIAPATVFDLGANIGLTAAHYKTLWPDARVVAVEMDADCAELARLNAPDCEVRRCAVSATGDTGFYDSSLWPSNFSFGNAGDTPVDSFTLAELLDGEPVDFVKMDVEGAEWTILWLGGWEHLVKSLLVELHGEDTDDRMVGFAISALERLGYTASPHKIHPRAVWAAR